MVELVLRNTTPEELRKLPRSFHTYVVFDKTNQLQIARVAWKSRYKNAGGAAFQAQVYDPQRHGNVTVWSTDLRKLCEIIRYVYTKEGEPPAHWR